MGLLKELKRAGTETVDGCNACQSKRNMRDSRFEKLLFLRVPFGVRLCLACGLRWLSPRPSSEGRRLLYSCQYYFEPDDLPAYEVFATERQAQFRERIENMVSRWGASSVLDFGAATGDFVAIARNTGIHAEGIEFSADARQQAYANHEIRLYAPDNLGNLPAPFDAIHMNHVLEHVPDPLGQLQWCYSLLRPGGGLIIEVPRQIDNDSDRFRRLLRLRGRQTKFDAFSVHHTYFFAPRNMVRIVKSAGFVVERLLTPIAPLANEASFKRKLFGYAMQVANQFHHGGDIIELWAHRPQ